MSCPRSVFLALTKAPKWDVAAWGAEPFPAGLDLGGVWETAEWLEKVALGRPAKDCGPGLGRVCPDVGPSSTFLVAIKTQCFPGCIDFGILLWD